MDGYDTGIGVAITATGIVRTVLDVLYGPPPRNRAERRARMRPRG